MQTCFGARSLPLSPLFPATCDPAVIFGRNWLSSLGDLLTIPSRGPRTKEQGQAPASVRGQAPRAVSLVEQESRSAQKADPRPNARGCPRDQ